MYLQSRDLKVMLFLSILQWHVICTIPSWNKRRFSLDEQLYYTSRLLYHIETEGMWERILHCALRTRALWDGSIRWFSTLQWEIGPLCPYLMKCDAAASYCPWCCPNWYAPPIWNILSTFLFSHKIYLLYVRNLKRKANKEINYYRKTERMC